MTVRRNIVLLGYLGKQNFGDEVMAEAVAQILADAEVTFIHARTPMRDVLRAYWRADLLAVCGGNIVNHSHGAYLRVTALAWLMRVPMAFLSIEVTDWPSRFLVRAVQKAIFRKASISVRTVRSAMVIARLLPRKSVPCVVDLFYCHHAFLGPGAAQAVDRFSRGSGGTKARTLHVLPRSFKRVHEGYSESQNLDRIAASVSNSLETGHFDRVVLSPSACVDEVAPYHARLQQDFGAEISIECLGIDAPITFASNDSVISNRLHIAKLCNVWDVPCTLISYSLKTELPEIGKGAGQVFGLGGQKTAFETIGHDPALLSARRDMSLRTFEAQLAP
jgi:hypothetical protein